MSMRIKHLLILLVVCGLVFGFKAGERDFWGRHGEARRAEVSREMVVSGNWVVPHLNGEPFVTKPPLYYWAAAWMFTLTGNVDELSARLPSIISGTLGVIITYLWASTLFSTRVGLFAGIILATSFLYGGMARTAGVDMLLTLFISASLYFFTSGYLRQNNATRNGKRWNTSTFMYVLSTICIALGNLAKNPIGVVVPLLVIGVFIVLSRDFKAIIKAKPWWLLLVFLVITLPWFVMVYLRVPNFFDIFHQETLGRYTNPEGTPHYEPFYFYLPALEAFAPWIMFLPGVVISLISGKKYRKLAPGHLLVLIAFITTFVLFSSVGSKREYYLLPLYPFLAILAAKYWDEYLGFKEHSKARWTWKAMDIPLVIFAGVLCIIGPALPIATPFYLPQYMLLSVIFGALFLVCGITLFRTFLRGHVLQTFGIYSIATILIYIFVLLTIVPEMDAYRSRKDFLHEAKTIVGDHFVIDYKYEGYAPQFYMQRIIPMITEAEKLETFINRQEPVFIIMQYGHYGTLQREAPDLAKYFEIVLDQVWRSATNPKRQKRLLLVKSDTSPSK